MAPLTVYGSPFSSFVRTTRMALEEMGVAYHLVPVAPGETDGAARHPFGRIPFMRWGDFVLAESLAIIRFVDRAFDGPKLWPAGLMEAALCDQWVSAISDTVSLVCGRGICFPRLAAPVLGFSVDEAAIAAAAALLPGCLAELDQPLAKTPFLVGDGVTAADLYLLPIMHYLAMTPEGAAALPHFPNIQAWQGRMQGRASVQHTMPPSFEILQNSI